VQIGPEGTAAIVTDGVTDGLTTITIPVDDAVVGDAQAAFETILTDTTSPLAIVEEGKVADVAPGTFTPFICH
jgi:hypothetical protein